MQDAWELLTRFLRTRSVATRRSYTAILKEWSNYLGVRAGTADGTAAMISASQKDVDTFLAQLSTTGSPATRAKKHSALRRLYRELSDAGLLANGNPFRKSPSSSGPSVTRAPLELSLEEVRALLDAPSCNNPKGLRDRALLALLFGAALKRGEICALTVGAVRRCPLQGSTLMVSGPAGEPWSLPVAAWLWGYLEPLVAHRTGEGAPRDAPLFVSYVGKGGSIPTSVRISESGVYRLFRQYAKSVGLRPEISPHSARISAIFQLLDRGLDPEEVRLFSRHRSTRMLKEYARRRRVSRAA